MLCPSLHTQQTTLGVSLWCTVHTSIYFWGKNSTPPHRPRYNKAITTKVVPVYSPQPGLHSRTIFEQIRHALNVTTVRQLRLSIPRPPPHFTPTGQIDRSCFLFWKVGKYSFTNSDSIDTKPVPLECCSSGEQNGTSFDELRTAMRATKMTLWKRIPGSPNYTSR